jgi:ribosomal protein RSM22 (predicted rRNA methylase)
VTACLATLPQDFSTKSVLDAGSGPRTASRETVAAYPNISAVTFQDNNAKFFKLTKHLLAQSSNVALAGSTALEGGLQAKQDLSRADMLIAAYAFNELPLIDTAEAEF